MTNGGKVLIRFAEWADAEECNEFHNRLREDMRSLDQWKWEFVSDAWGTDPVPFVVAESDDGIVGTQACIPVRMIDQNGVFWSAKSEETLLDPRYRGKNYLGEMYRKLFEYASERGAVYVWGFTTATKALKRVGYEVPATTTQLVMPFMSSAVVALQERSEGSAKAAASSRFKRTSYLLVGGAAAFLSRMQFALRSRALPEGGAPGFEVRVESHAPAESGALCSRFVKRWGGATIYRDAQYLEWRIFQNPYTKGIFIAARHDGQLIGWVIFSLAHDGVAYLIDILVDVPETMHTSTEHVVGVLLARATEAARNMGAVAMRGWRVTDHPFDMIVSREAQRIGYYHIRRGGSMVLYRLASTPDRSSSESVSNWYVTRLYTEGVSG